MRLLEAIVQANHRAAGGDTSAGLRPADYADSLPLVALSCIDARLNPLLPEVLGVPEDQFVWLRNAGNIITGPLSSTMRSLALACAIKGGKEIAIIGHSDCLVGKTGTMELLERFRALGIDRRLLPENITEYFGIFASERQNVIRAADTARQSPLIGTGVPVHGLLLDLQTGKIEWLVNGYETANTVAGHWNEFVHSAGETVDALKKITDLQIGDMKFPETRIGEAVVKAGDWLEDKVRKLELPQPNPPAEPRPAATPKVVPLPPKIPVSPEWQKRLSIRKRTR